MKTPHYDVIIATPGASVKMEYLRSLIETTKWLNSVGKTYHLLSRFSSFVPSAREKTLTDSAGQNWDAIEVADGAFTYEKLLWIDSDIEWDVETVERLLSHSADIVGAMMPVNANGAVGAMRLDELGEPVSLNWTDFMLEEGLVKVDGVALGMAVVGYGVIEGMKRPWFKIRHIRISGVPFLVNLGEDYSFCLNAKDSGFTVWVDTLAKVRHVKELILTI
jgi:hypothetical protein